ncbi:hypothetical protein MHEC_36870 [Mycobacterium heckeshornense]|uniref:Uncharacterized protein n=1 Tax=Mycobacterium heckeshornense TaxID=110505 RepID=A0A7R7GWN0_9MYCO|nr:hypothetical protein MHEC_36870 [Mycobacterium heckeshornense]
MHQLVGALGRSAQPCELVDQVDRALRVRCRGGYPRRGGHRLQWALLPGGAVCGDEDIDVVPRHRRAPGSESAVAPVCWSPRAGAPPPRPPRRGGARVCRRRMCRRASPTRRIGHRSTGPGGPVGPRRRTASRAPGPTTRRAHDRPPWTTPPHRSASRPPSCHPAVPVAHRLARTPPTHARAAARHSHGQGNHAGDGYWFSTSPCRAASAWPTPRFRPAGVRHRRSRPSSPPPAPQPSAHQSCSTAPASGPAAAWPDLRRS